MKWAGAVLGAIIGLVATYYAVAYAACTWFWPNSNLCGLIAVPAAFAGAVGGFMLVFKLLK